MNCMTVASNAVGFIGLGIMGNLLARRVLEHGIPLLIYNRTAAKCLPLQTLGAELATSPAEVAARCNYIFTVLTGPDALRDVLFGPQGICSRRYADQRIVCDLSTQDPQFLRELATVLPSSVLLTEAPMAGSVHDAAHGSLQFLQGGDAQALAVLSSYFRVWGPTPIYFGQLGSASTAKLALNLLLGLMAEGLAEALKLLRLAKVSEQDFITVLDTSGLRSPVFQRLWQRHLDQDAQVRFSLANLCKDIKHCASHPAWAENPPALLDTLNARLAAVPKERQSADYSTLLALS
jgi:3-hydroxyisobutyrate dehydrogenase-like beta-hydroxyacid dehydrogenase